MFDLAALVTLGTLFHSLEETEAEKREREEELQTVRDDYKKEIKLLKQELAFERRKKQLIKNKLEKAVTKLEVLETHTPCNAFATASQSVDATEAGLATRIREDDLQQADLDEYLRGCRALFQRADFSSMSLPAALAADSSGVLQMLRRSVSDSLTSLRMQQTPSDDCKLEEDLKETEAKGKEAMAKLLAGVDPNAGANLVMSAMFRGLSTLPPESQTRVGLNPTLVQAMSQMAGGYDLDGESETVAGLSSTDGSSKATGTKLLASASGFKILKEDSGGSNGMGAVAHSGFQAVDSFDDIGSALAGASLGVGSGFNYANVSAVDVFKDSSSIPETSEDSLLPIIRDAVAITSRSDGDFVVVGSDTTLPLSAVDRTEEVKIECAKDEDKEKESSTPTPTAPGYDRTPVTGLGTVDSFKDIGSALTGAALGVGSGVNFADVSAVDIEKDSFMKAIFDASKSGGGLDAIFGATGKTAPGFSGMGGGPMLILGDKKKQGEEMEQKNIDESETAAVKKAADVREELKEDKEEEEDSSSEDESDEEEEDLGFSQFWGRKDMGQGVDSVGSLLGMSVCSILTFVVVLFVLFPRQQPTANGMIDGNDSCKLPLTEESEANASVIGECHGCKCDCARDCPRQRCVCEGQKQCAVELRSCETRLEEALGFSRKYKDELESAKIEFAAYVGNT